MKVSNNLPRNIGVPATTGPTSSEVRMKYESTAPTPEPPMETQVYYKNPKSAAQKAKC